MSSSFFFMKSPYCMGIIGGNDWRCQCGYGCLVQKIPVMLGVGPKPPSGSVCSGASVWNCLARGCVLRAGREAELAGVVALAEAPPLIGGEAHRAGVRAVGVADLDVTVDEPRFDALAVVAAPVRLLPGGTEGCTAGGGCCLQIRPFRKRPTRPRSVTPCRGDQIIVPNKNVCW